MKICYLGDGGSIHVKRWCLHFASLGHQIHLISFKDCSIEGVQVHFIDAGNISVKGGNWKVLMKAGAVRKLLHKIKPDVVHSHYATSYGLVGALANYHPYVVTTLGSDVLISPKESKIYRGIVKYVFKKADWITAMADHMKQTIIDLGANPEKVATVIFGIDSSVFNHNQRQLPDEFVVTNTRNLEPVYNVGYMLQAVSKVCQKIPNLAVNIAGDGTQREMLEKLTESLGIKDKVKFLGKCTQPTLAELLNKTHLFISVSLSDGNNISLNEAMACGTVSLASDIPANRQWIKEGINGFLVPLNDVNVLADKILYVYKNYTELQKTAIEFNDRIIEEKATWSKNMAFVEKMYIQLSNKK